MANFIEQNLLADEKIILSTKLHWVLYIPSIILTVLAIVLIFSIQNLGGILIVFGILYLIYNWLLIKSSEFAVTNKRLMMKKGILSTKTLELYHAKTESMSISQGITGKIFGYGNIAVIGSGGTINYFKMIEKPFEIRKAAQDEINKVQKTK